MTATLDRDRSALLIIDIQTRLSPAIAGGAAAAAEAGRLAHVAQLLRVPVFATEQSPEVLGHTLPKLAPLIDTVLVKTSFDACRTASVRAALSEERPQLVICGFEAHVCVLQTALGLLALGRSVYVARDAVGSRVAANCDAALARLAAHGAEIVTAEMVAFEWTADARHPRFREVLALVN